MQTAIGVDKLSESIRNSNILTDYNLEQLATVQDYPAIDPSFDDNHLKQIIQYYSLNPEDMERELHTYAKKLLEKDKLYEAWQVLLAG